MPRLLVVATPIGNMGDLSPRMCEALTNCDLIAAEDTRVTMKLTQHLGIRKPMISCHRHNEDAKKHAIIEKMIAEDLTVALTCDAGTPGISDPGEQLVASAWEAGIPIEPVSGPSAIITALSLCGYDTREFAFYGFLPRETAALKQKLIEIQATGISPAVIYESPHRVTELLQCISSVLNDAHVTVCCDLTKKFERIDRGSVSDVLAALSQNPNREKGEYCVVMRFQAKKNEESAEREPETAELKLLKRMLDGESLNEAMDALKQSGVKRNDLYRAKLTINKLMERLSE